MWKNVKKIVSSAAVIAGILLFILLLAGRKGTDPSNPMEKEADPSRMYQTASVLAMDQSVLEGIANVNIQTQAGEEQTEEEQKEEEQKEEQSEEQTEEEQQREDGEESGENPGTEAQVPGLNSDSLSGLLPLISRNPGKNNSGSGEQGEIQNPGEGDGEGEGEGTVHGGTDQNPDPSAEWFVTSILDQDTIEIPEYPFTITLTEAGKNLSVVSRSLEVNGELRSCGYEDTAVLKEGSNQVRVTLQFQNNSGKRFRQSKEYTLYYVPENRYGIFVRNVKTGAMIEGDLTVREETMTLEVWAKKGGKDVEPKVRLNGESISKGEDGYYGLRLNPGQNALQLSAGYGQNKITKSLTLTYAMDEFTLRMESPAISEEIVAEQFNGRSWAFYEADSSEFSFRVSCPNTGEGRITQVTVGSGNQSYTPQPNASGYRTIDLYAAGETPIRVDFLDEAGQAWYYLWNITYKRNYTPPDREPVINMNLTDGQEVTSAEYILTVDAHDYRANPIYDIQVKINGTEVSSSGISGIAQQYHLPLQAGENELEVTAADKEQYQKTEIRTIYYLPDQSVTASLYVSVDVLGLGTLIREPQVTVPGNTTIARLVVDRLAAYGIESVYSGTPESSGFYLKRMNRPGTFAGAYIPEWEKQFLTEHGYTFDDPLEVDPDSLGEFDYTKGSGWMITLNDYYIGEGMGTHCVEDGDVIRIQFTLALGADIGVDPDSGIYG